MKSFIFVLPALLAVTAGHAQFNVCGDTNLPGTYIKHTVTPSGADARTTGKNNPQFACISTNGAWRNQLVVFFPGTGGVPASFDNFCQNAANLGFHALALTYDNDTSLDDFCGNDPNADCYFEVRTEFLTGTNSTTKTNITRVNSIEFRLAAFLNYLHTNNPAEGWGQYLIRTNQFWANALAWTNFILAGHSQGSGYAAFIAKQREVQRVVTFVGGDYWLFGEQAAAWNFLPSATPVERWFGFTHSKDAFPVGVQMPKWEAQELTRFGPVVDVTMEQPPYHYSHTFASTLEPCPNVFGNIEYHGATVNDPPQVRDSNGVPFYAGVWTHMLTGPLLPPPGTTVFADSVRDFSPVQGSNGWRYGFWNRTGDANGTYQAADFSTLPTFDKTLYAIPSWVRSNDLQVAIWSTGARPHFVNTNDCCTNRASGPELWPVRRWVSPGAGEVQITGWLSKWDSIGGDGITGSIRINGTTVWSAFVDGTNIYGTNFNVAVNLNVGAVVDFMVAPGASADWDGVRFTAQILEPPGPCPMPLLHARPAGDDVELRWEACTNAAYQLESAANLPAWNTASSPLAAPPGGGWMTNIVSLDQTQEFFRLRVLPLTNSVVPSSPGNYSLHLTADGLPRHYRLTIPTNYSASTPAPLILIFHGHGQTADAFAAQHPKLAHLANERGVILVLPDSTSNERGTGWNTFPPTEQNPVDDVSFILQLIETLDATLSIDRKRVYAGGFSNGGQMCHLLTSQTTNVFAAIAAVGSAIGGMRGTDGLSTNPPPSGPIPALIVNATNDCARPFWGDATHTAARDALIHYTNANFCTSLSALSTNYFVTNNGAISRYEACPPNGRPPMALITNLVIREHYQITCAPGTEVLFITLTDGGHKWPDAGDNVGFDASLEVFDFFLRHCRCDAAGATAASAPTTPGTHHIGLCDQGYWRTMRLQIPASYSAASATPVVFTMHGGGQTVASFSAEHPALFTKANMEGVILVMPEALEHPVSRDTLWMNKPFDYVADDRVFFSNAVEHLDAVLNVDRKRIYACGFSSGGAFSHWMAGTTTGLLAAIAPVCTQTGWNEPDNNGPIVAPPPPLEPIPVLIVRGTNDTTRPYYGGTNYLGNLCRSAADDVNYWTNGNMCAAGYTTSTSGPVTTYEYSACAGTSEVVLVRIDGMPHIWPDAADGFGFDANSDVIDFLLMHARP